VIQNFDQKEVKNLPKEPALNLSKGEPLYSRTDFFNPLSFIIWNQPVGEQVPSVGEQFFES
jgi:hypothetical protein